MLWNKITENRGNNYTPGAYVTTYEQYLVSQADSHLICIFVCCITRNVLYVICNTNLYRILFIKMFFYNSTESVLISNMRWRPKLGRHLPYFSALTFPVTSHSSPDSDTHQILHIWSYYILPSLPWSSFQFYLLYFSV